MFVDRHFTRMENPDVKNQFGHMCSHFRCIESDEATRIEKTFIVRSLRIIEEFIALNGIRVFWIGCTPCECEQTHRNCFSWMQCALQFQLFHTVDFIRQKHRLVFYVSYPRVPSPRSMHGILLRNVYNVFENVSGVCSAKLFEYMFAHY